MLTNNTILTIYGHDTLRPLSIRFMFFAIIVVVSSMFTQLCITSESGPSIINLRQLVKVV
jgi:hypothetical protein